MQAPEGALGLDLVDAGAHRRIGDQADLSVLEAGGGQSYARRHVGVLRIEPCRPAGVALVVDDGLGEAVQVTRRLSRCSLRGGRRLARGVDDALDAPSPCRRQGVDPGAGAGRDKQLHPERPSPAAQLFEKLGVGQGADGNNREVDGTSVDEYGVPNHDY